MTMIPMAMTNSVVAMWSPYVLACGLVVRCLHLVAVTALVAAAKWW
jgi:hypothetical protein